MSGICSRCKKPCHRIGGCLLDFGCNYCGCVDGNLDDHLFDDPRDAEIARLKAEVEQLRKSEADLIQGIFDDGQRAGIEPADLSPTEVLTKMADDLARHQRALAAGPAAVRRQENVDVNTREAYARVVEVAQAAAMKEDK